MTIIIPYDDKTDKTAIFNESRDSVGRIYSRLGNRVALRGIYLLSPNYSLLQRKSGNGGNASTSVEQLVCNLLIASGIVSDTAHIRHGETSKSECDLVINEAEQIEVVTAMFDDAGLEDKLLSCFAYEKEVVVPTAVLKKFDEKNYTQSYPKSICIVYGGNANNESALAIAIRDHLFDHRGIPSKNVFTTVYMVRYDVSSDSYNLLMATVSDEPRKCNVPCDGKAILPMVHKKQVLLNQIVAENLYFLDTAVDRTQDIPALVVRGSQVVDVIKRYGWRTEGEN